MTLKYLKLYKVIVIEKDKHQGNNYIRNREPTILNILTNRQLSMVYNNWYKLKIQMNLKFFVEVNL